MLKSRDGKVAAYGGEIVKKFVERMAALQIVDERLEWHPCPGKHRLSAQNIRIGMNRRY